MVDCSRYIPLASCYRRKQVMTVLETIVLNKVYYCKKIIVANGIN